MIRIQLDGAFAAGISFVFTHAIICGPLTAISLLESLHETTNVRPVIESTAHHSKAVTYKALGGPEVIEYVERTVRVPAAGEVRI
jgi:hypothetical protein